MKPERKVVWERGVLMLPQHLQQMERYQESLVASRVEALQPNAWGVLEMRFDERALAEQKVVKLDRFLGVLTDGTPVSVEAPLVLEAPDPPAHGAIGIYLALPYEEPKVNNYAAGEGVFLRRYAIDATEIHDSAADTPRGDSLRLASPHTRLIPEGSPQLDRCARVKIAEVRQGHAGPVFDPTYIPPCLRVSASPFLARRIVELRKKAEYRLGVLHARRRFSPDGTVEWNAFDVTKYLHLSAINALLPALHYMERSADLSPLQVFLLLTQGVGQLAASSTEVDMREPFDFDFLRLRETFERVLDSAVRLLADMGGRSYVQVELQYRQDLFVAALEEPRLPGLSRYILAVKSEEPADEVIHDVVASAKVSSPEVVRTVLMPNLPGTPIAAIGHHEQDACRKLPVQIERQPGWLYFNIPAAGADGARWWDAVWAARQIGIWLPAKYESAKVQLLGVLDTTSD
ncbi:MAG: type VI secretion system baseplate subunit TssK [Myxococcales bacterium]|nr:type VI secretion system baseplate subunit TssK [Myxococcales bacterium]